MFVKIGPYPDSYYGKVSDFLRNLGISKEWRESLSDMLARIPISKKLPERKIEICVDPYDTWDLHSTLSLILLPMLKQLREKMHGAPYTDDDDVPEHLRSSSAPPKENEWDTDELHFDRWNWIMDEMIWAIEQDTIDWEDQFHSGELDVVFNPVDLDGNPDDSENPKFFEFAKGPNDTHEFDKEGHLAHFERMQNGLRLFGKYYFNLWD